MDLKTEINNALMRNCYRSVRAFAINNGFKVVTVGKVFNRIAERNKPPIGDISLEIVSCLKEKTGLDLIALLKK